MTYRNRALSLVSPSPGTNPSAPRRIKIRELEHRHHCSIVGTCLDLEELRRLCRKTGFRNPRGACDYALHIHLVSLMGSDPKASRLVNRYLDRKYTASIRSFERAETRQERETLWREAVARGEVAGAYWAAVTDPRTPDDLLFRIYGEIHMLSHLSGASVRIDMQALHRLRRRVPELEQELAESRARLLRRAQEKEQAVRRLNERTASLQETERALSEARSRLQELENGAQLRQLRSLLAERERRLRKATRRAERAEAAAQKWRSRAEAAAATIHTLQQKMDGPATRGEPDRPSSCGEESCAGHNSDLCRRCILYVGGRNRQQARFRTLVERNNGHFIHHDGGVEESSQRLAELLPRADVVLCPLDCVSHDAVQRIVRYCKQHGKTFKLLPKSSLAAFSRGLEELFSDE